MAGQQVSAAFEGLPKQFVSSLRVLFDILDSDRSGFVFYTDIEKYWDENAVRGLPMGVLPCLKRATGKGGLLSFEGFVNALKSALFSSGSDAHRNVKNSQSEKNSYRPRDFPRSTSVPVTLANYRPGHPGLKGGYGLGYHNPTTTTSVHSSTRHHGPERTLSPTRPGVGGPTTATVRPNINPTVYPGNENVKQMPQNQEVKHVFQGRPLSERDPNQLQTKSDSAIIAKKPRDRAQSENVSSMVQKFETHTAGPSAQPGQYAGVPLTRGSKTQSLDTIVPLNSISNRPLSPPSEADKENKRHSSANDIIINNRYQLAPNRSHDRHISPPSNQNHHNINSHISPTSQNHHNSPVSPTNRYNKSPVSPTNQNYYNKISPTAQNQNQYSPVSPGQHQYSHSPVKSQRDRSPSAPPGGQYSHQGHKQPNVRTSNYFPPLREDDEVEQIYNQVAQDAPRISPERNVLSAMQPRDLEHRGPVARSSDPTSHMTSPPPRTSYRKVREPRRHTLQNGVDFNMVKRMKQLEKERDVLLQGLEAVDRARGWYQKQIHNIQEKQKNIGKSQHMDYSVEAQQERMNFQMARIYEVNQQLQALVQSSERGFPLHMNLALPSQRLGMDYDDERVDRLHDQNRVLNQEANANKDRITQLEREKSLLVRELFEEHAKRRPMEDASMM